MSAKAPPRTTPSSARASAPAAGWPGEEEIAEAPASPVVPEELRGYVSGWQTIETAPKDGSWIVLSDGQRVLPDRWIEWGRDGSASWDHFRYLQPIYWQPLPAPPSEPVPEQSRAEEEGRS